MTCFKGHSSSIYNFEINAFFFSHTSDEMDVFIIDAQSRGGWKGGVEIVHEDRGDQQKTDRKRARQRLLYVKRNK